MKIRYLGKMFLGRLLLQKSQNSSKKKIYRPKISVFNVLKGILGGKWAKM